MATIRRLKSKKYLAEVRKAKQYKSKTFRSRVLAMDGGPETKSKTENKPDFK